MTTVLVGVLILAIGYMIGWALGYHTAHRDRDKWDKIH